MCDPKRKESIAISRKGWWVGGCVSLQAHVHHRFSLSVHSTPSINPNSSLSRKKNQCQVHKDVPRSNAQTINRDPKAIPTTIVNPDEYHPMLRAAGAPLDDAPVAVPVAPLPVALLLPLEALEDPVAAAEPLPVVEAPVPVGLTPTRSVKRAEEV